MGVVLFLLSVVVWKSIAAGGVDGAVKAPTTSPITGGYRSYDRLSSIGVHSTPTTP